MEFVRSIRDDRVREIGWYCNGCGKPCSSLWCGLCKPCQRIEERHKELIAALKAVSA